MLKLSKDYLDERKNAILRSDSISLGTRPLSALVWGRGPYQYQLGGEALISISLGARPLSSSVPRARSLFVSSVGSRCPGSRCPCCQLWLGRGAYYIISSEGEVPICQQCWVEVPRVEVPLLSVVVPGRGAQGRGAQLHHQFEGRGAPVIHQQFRDASQGRGARCTINQQTGRPGDSWRAR